MQYNNHDENLDFLAEKIKDIRIALFKSHINAELQLPNNIIQVLRVEDDGTALFFTSCNGDYADKLTTSFFAELDFYKKGTQCRLHLNGTATIVKEDVEELLNQSNYSKGTADRLVLVRFKITQAEYFENKPENISWKERIKAAFNHLFVMPSHRVYDFS
jgi:hypothetical protein